MSNPFAPKKIKTDKYKKNSELIDDLVDLGWDYTSGRMSRSGMFVYDQIMTRLGILQDGEHWNEDVYADANGDW